MVKIEINGTEVMDTHDYAVHFVKEDGQYRPVLAYKGKRVIQQWEVAIVHNQPQDMNGCSA